MKKTFFVLAAIVLVFGGVILFSWLVLGYGWNPLASPCSLPSEQSWHGEIQPPWLLPFGTDVIENQGQVCFSPAPSGNLPANNLRVQVYSSGCYSSSCSVVYERRGQMEIDQTAMTIQLSSRFAVKRLGYTLLGANCLCTADCGGAGLLEYQTGNLPDGAYQVYLGENQLGSLTLPLTHDLCLEKDHPARVGPEPTAAYPPPRALLPDPSPMASGVSPTTMPYPAPGAAEPTSASPTATLFPTATPSPTATSLPERIEIHFDNLSLLWRECELPRPQDQSQEECLGVTMAKNNPDDASPFAERFTPPGGIMPGWRLTIGSDIYEAVHQPYNEKSFTNPKGEAEHRLYKNGELLLTIKSGLMGFENASLMNIHGKYAWEFANLAEPTVIYDGVDLRLKFGLEGLYRPQVIGENIVFVAKDNGKMFVLVDGKQIGPTFDEIANGYCCETPRIVRPPGQLWFWGSREGRHFVVVITASP